MGSQPNSPPHMGTLVTFALAFAIGERIDTNKKSVYFEIVDTAPAEILVIDGVRYQRSLRDTGKSTQILEYYKTMMEVFSESSGVEYRWRNQKEFNSNKRIPRIIKTIKKKKKKISPLLDPKNRRLRLRSPCPECGLTDKDSKYVKFNEDSIEFFCPSDGWFNIDIEKESYKLEYNTPLRNLIRGILYSEENKDSKIPWEWIRVTGSDYAGFYQETLLYRAASLLGSPSHNLPYIVYTPLITDWSGAKLSKSLYVKQGAYQDIPAYLIDLSRLLDEKGKGGITRIFEEVSSWLDEPYKLFRNYSVYYFKDKVFGDA